MHQRRQCMPQTAVLTPPSRGPARASRTMRASAHWILGPAAGVVSRRLSGWAASASAKIKSGSSRRPEVIAPRRGGRRSRRPCAHACARSRWTGTPDLVAAAEAHPAGLSRMKGLWHARMRACDQRLGFVRRRPRSGEAITERVERMRMIGLQLKHAGAGTLSVGPYDRCVRRASGDLVNGPVSSVLAQGDLEAYRGLGRTLGVARDLRLRSINSGGRGRDPRRRCA